jgi:hypothetical protein
VSDLLDAFRAADDHEDGWSVQTSTGQQHTLTTTQITNGYRLV